eukprot:gene38030-46207_t
MSEKDREKELLLSPLVPFAFVTPTDFDAYRTQICENILKQVKEIQRVKRVEALKLQMKQNKLHQSNLQYSSSNHPLSATNAAFSDSDLSSTSSLEDSPPLRLSASIFQSPSNSQAHPLSPISSEGSPRSPVIRLPRRPRQPPTSPPDNPNAITSTPYLPSPPPDNVLNLYPSPTLLVPPAALQTSPQSLRDEIFWDFTLPQKPHLLDSKLFFFASLLWKVCVGVNNHHADFYYVFLSPAERLPRDLALYVEFVLHAPTGCASPPVSPHSTDDSVQPYVKASEQLFHFPRDVNTSRGFEKFIGKEVSKYLSPHNKVRMSIRLCLQRQQQQQQQQGSARRDQEGGKFA